MNPLLAPQGMPQPQQAQTGPMGQPGPLMAPGAALTPPPTQHTKEAIDEARKHGAAVVGGLSDLTSKPRGELTKEDVFKAASDMIGKGAFPNPQSKQSLIAALTQLPDDEPSLRSALGKLLLQSAANLAKLHEIHGPG